MTLMFSSYRLNHPSPREPDMGSHSVITFLETSVRTLPILRSTIECRPEVVLLETRNQRSRHLTRGNYRWSTPTIDSTIHGVSRQLTQLTFLKSSHEPFIVSNVPLTTIID